MSTIDVKVYGMETVLAGRVSVMTSVDQTVLAGAAEDDQPSALAPARIAIPPIKMLLANLIV